MLVVAFSVPLWKKRTSIDNLFHFLLYLSWNYPLQKLVFHFRKCSCHVEIELFVESGDDGYVDVDLKHSGDDHKILIHYRLK